MIVKLKDENKKKIGFLEVKNDITIEKLKDLKDKFKEESGGDLNDFIFYLADYYDIAAEIPFKIEEMYF